MRTGRCSGSIVVCVGRRLRRTAGSRSTRRATRSSWGSRGPLMRLLLRARRRPGWRRSVSPCGRRRGTRRMPRPRPARQAVSSPSARAGETTMTANGSPKNATTFASRSTSRSTSLPKRHLVWQPSSSRTGSPMVNPCRTRDGHGWRPRSHWRLTGRRPPNVGPPDAGCRYDQESGLGRRAPLLTEALESSSAVSEPRWGKDVRSCGLTLVLSAGAISTRRGGCSTMPRILSIPPGDEASEQKAIMGIAGVSLRPWSPLQEPSSYSRGVVARARVEGSDFALASCPQYTLGEHRSRLAGPDGGGAPQTLEEAVALAASKDPPRYDRVSVALQYPVALRARALSAPRRGARRLPRGRHDRVAMSRGPHARGVHGRLGSRRRSRRRRRRRVGARDLGAVCRAVPEDPHPRLIPRESTPISRRRGRCALRRPGPRR